MDLERFRASLGDPAPPEGLPPLLRALWHAGRDDWDTAHRIAQEDDTAEGAWVHAHLHRVEGDESNAGYWYRRAGRPHSAATLEAEWTEIVQALL
ncbi:MAG: hypothetical protein ACFCUW_12815 [Kiloniellaceae bacterium]